VEDDPSIYIADSCTAISGYPVVTLCFSLRFFGLLAFTLGVA
jgi:hypothetical protein